MALQLGDIAPDFTAETTAGTIRFHEWLGDSWGVLFSPPRDFTRTRPQYSPSAAPLGMATITRTIWR